jgi:hypothetical protein
MDTHVLVATPSYDGKVVFDYVRSLLKMVRLADSRGIKTSFAPITGGSVSRGRNTATATLMAHDFFTHLLHIDADMGWPPEALLRLLNADKDIVGCTYPKRMLTERPQYIGGLEAGALAEDGFVRARYVGFGFTLVKREAIEKMIAFYPWASHKDEANPNEMWNLCPDGMNLDTGTYQSEDVQFCHLATEAGLEVWADIALPLTHTGPVTFDLGPMARWLEFKEPTP